MNTAPPRAEHPVNHDRVTSDIQMTTLPVLPTNVPPMKPPRLAASSPTFQDMSPRSPPTTDNPFPETAIAIANDKAHLNNALEKSVSTYSLLDAGAYIQMMDPAKCALFPPQKRPSPFQLTDSDELMCLSTLADAAEMPPTARQPQDSDPMPEGAFQELLALISSKTSLDARLTEPGEISFY